MTTDIEDLMSPSLPILCTSKKRKRPTFEGSTSDRNMECTDSENLSKDWREVLGPLPSNVCNIRVHKKIVQDKMIRLLLNKLLLGKFSRLVNIS